jgi:hypothetical protein
MPKTRTKARSDLPRPVKVFELALLGLCLSLMVLRGTYTEAPIANASMPNNLSDTVYSLTLTGLMVAALLLWLVRSLWRGPLHYRVTGIEIGLGLFILGGVVSGWAASDKRLAISQTMILLGPIIMAVLLVQLLDSAARIRAVLLVLGALGILSAYQCAEQYAISNEITIEQYEKAPELLLEPLGIEPGTFQHFLFEHRLYSRGVRGFFTTSNSAASFALLAAFAAFALLLMRRNTLSDSNASRRRLLPYTGIGLAIVVIGLFLTQSKGGILGFLAAGALFGLWFVLRPWLAAHRRRALLLFGTLTVVGFVVAVSATISYGMKHGRLPGGNSMLVRWQYWRASAQMVADHPLTGVGPGNFAHVYPKYKPAAALESVADPHDFPLSLLAQYGPLGLLGFLAMIFVPLWGSTVPGKEPDPTDTHGPSSRSGRLAVTMLAVTALTMLLVRPFLVPPSSGGDGALVLYQIVVLYVAPAAAYLIGFVLLAAPLKPRTAFPRGWEWTPITAALACAILGVLLHNLIDFAIFEPGVWTAFWIVVACLVATNIQRQQRPPAIVSPSAAVRPLASTVSVAIMGLYALFVWRPVFAATRHIEQAETMASTGWFDKAHHLLDEADEADPLSSTALSLNGRLYLQEYEHSHNDKTLEKAATCFENASQTDPADYKNYEKAGMVYRLLGQDQKAYDWYLQAAAHYPGCGRLHFQLGQIADQLGWRDRARKQYAEAIRIEEAFQVQFHLMYPDRQKVVSRLGEADFRIAQQRLAELSK